MFTTRRKLLTFCSFEGSNREGLELFAHAAEIAGRRGTAVAGDGPDEGNDGVVGFVVRGGVDCDLQCIGLNGK